MNTTFGIVLVDTMYFQIGLKKTFQKILNTKKIIFIL